MTTRSFAKCLAGTAALPWRAAVSAMLEKRGVKTQYLEVGGRAAGGLRRNSRG